MDINQEKVEQTVLALLYLTSFKDKFGLSWQIVPRVLMEAINDPDAASAKRAMQAMMQMVKIDIAKIEAARRG